MTQKELIQKIVKEQNLTMTELAAVTGRSATSISTYFNGHRKMPKMFILLLLEKKYIKKEEVKNLEFK